MKYEFTSKNNLPITEGMKDAAINKLSKLEKHGIIKDDSICRVVVKTYDKNDKMQKVEITIPTFAGIVRTETSGDDFYEILTEARKKLDGQLRKYKTKIENRHKHKDHNKERILEVENSEVIIHPTELVILEEESIDTALEHLKMVKRNFYAFKNADSGRVNIILGSDKDFELIELA